MSNAPRRSRRQAAETAQSSPAAPVAAPAAATPATNDDPTIPSVQSVTPPAAPAAGDAEGAGEGGNAPAHGGAGGESNAGEASEAVAEGEVGARAALAPVVEAQLQAQTRETLIGTIGDWAASGIAEMDRVFDLLGEHDYSGEELETFRAAFDGLRLEAMTRAELLAAQRDALRLERLDEGLELLGLNPAEILSISPDLRRVVTTDGRKVELA